MPFRFPLVCLESFSLPVPHLGVLGSSLLECHGDVSWHDQIQPDASPLSCSVPDLVHLELLHTIPADPLSCLCQEGGSQALRGPRGRRRVQLCLCPDEQPHTLPGPAERPRSEPLRRPLQGAAYTQNSPPGLSSWCRLYSARSTMAPLSRSCPPTFDCATSCPPIP